MSDLFTWIADLPEMSKRTGNMDDLLWASDDEAAQVLWILFRPGYLVTLFVAGWAVDVSIFSRFRVEYSLVLGLAKDEAVSPQQLWALAFSLGISLGFFRLSLISQLPSPMILWSILFIYALALLSVFIWLPQPLARQFRWRVPLARALWRCVCPDGSKEVPFIEVLVADGLTSMAKVFFDLALGSCVAITSTDFSSSTFPNGMVESNSTAFMLPTQSQTLLGNALEKCRHSPWPFIAWASPFLIRARQCVVTSRHAPDMLSRDLQRVNFLKYMSALPVIGFSYCYARTGPRMAWLIFNSEDFEAMWAMAAVINSIFSFLWDMVMDWGLLQPAPWHTIHFGLRPVLLFRGIWGFYHIAIILNLSGRTLWSLRWSPQATAFLGSFFLGSFQQIAEILRRCLWNVLRVEWECIKKNVHRADKHFPV